jgi:choline dehydrogenase-like flavoprotein
MILRGAGIAADHTLDADVAVIGTGAGGAVAAAELAERGARVVVLEEGAYRRGADFDGRPLRSIPLLYRGHGLQVAIGNAVIPIPTGRCVGGTTTINSGTCYRALDAAFAKWEREFGLAGLRDEMASCYERVERAIAVAPVPEALLGNGERLAAAASARLGWRAAAIPRNAAGCRGTGACAFGCPRDAKQATHVSYVPRALAAGATLVTGARADRVETRAGAAAGVIAALVDDEGRRTGAALRVRADRVVVAAGALATPVLLARSGLGGRGSHVGRHLHVHPAVRVLATLGERVAAWEGVPQAWHVAEFEPEGIFLQGQFVPPSLHAPNLPGFGLAHKRRMADYARMTSFGALISDASEGRVLANGSVLYWMRRADVAKLQRAVVLVARLLFEAGAREVHPGVRGHPTLAGAADLAALERARLRAADFDMMAFHPMGTARRAADRVRGAVGPDGEHFACRRLHVADASLLPASCGVNPQLTIMALATRVADRIAAA